jgi:hypothetical protein
MGLDVSHGAFRGSYSGFARFREAVFVAAGGRIPRSKIGLREFLEHSDHDGQISPELAAACADDMEELLPVLDEMAEKQFHTNELAYGERARIWIAGCRLAAENGEPLEFT